MIWIYVALSIVIIVFGICKTYLIYKEHKEAEQYLKEYGEIWKRHALIEIYDKQEGIKKINEENKK